MKVLMFGWEFPPHISGGLGTACYGLTQSLGKEQVEILFVVPKLQGGESAERTSFINASEIPVLHQSLKYNETSLRESSLIKNIVTKNLASGSSQTITTIEVSAALNPYTIVSNSEATYGLQQWSYEFKEDRTDQHTMRHVIESQGVESRKHAYNFSGSYGPKLIEEVARYAQVGGEIAAANNFDVIHAHDWMTYQAGIEAKRISGKPLVVHVHATEYDRSGENVDPRVHAIELEGMLAADKVITVSQWTKNIAISRYGIQEDKIEVVHNGITPKEEVEIGSTPPPFGTHVVTFLGRITHQKGPLYFVEAARRVHQRFPDAHFVVAGSGDQLPLMIERIAQLRLSSRFHFTGFLKGKDIDRIWSMSNVYVMPSVSEPFGIAPLEAIQAGVPIIISNQAGVAEVMPHAIKADFWNADALAEAICSVLKYKSLHNTLKKHGTEEIKNITWDKAAKKLTSLYYELSARN